jgi:hypothetical protein
VIATERFCARASDGKRHIQPKMRKPAATFFRVLPRWMDGLGG